MSSARDDVNADIAADKRNQKAINDLVLVMRQSYQVLREESKALDAIGGRDAKLHKKCAEAHARKKEADMKKVQSYLDKKKEERDLNVDHKQSVHNPAFIMSEAIRMAGGKENFNPNLFKVAMKVMILGSGFKKLRVGIEAEEEVKGTKV